MCARKTSKIEGDFLIRKHIRWMAAVILATNLAVAPTGVMAAPGDQAAAKSNAASATAATPIKHLVIIFQENISFDHYFGTYPNALNTTKTEPVFQPAAHTPTVNGYTP